MARIGKSMYGKCDQIEGEGYVGTMFFHISSLPVIPLGSMFVTARSGRAYCGIDLPLSWKSVLLGYLRAAGWSFAIAAGFVTVVFAYGLVGLQEPMLSPVGQWLGLFGMGVVTAVSGLGLWASYRLTHASPERRAELLALLGRGCG